MNTFEWLETTAIAEWLMDSLYGYPIILTSHSIGMAVVVGILCMFGMRLLGLFNGISYDAFKPLLKVAWVGFLLNFFTGCILFTQKATVFISNWPFLIKIAAILVAVFVAAMLQNKMKDESEEWKANGDVTASARWLAIASLTFWLVAIIAGRMIAYLDQ